MNFCGIVLGVLTCLLDPAVKPTPAEAAAILASHQYQHMERRPLGPTVTIVQSKPGEGPFGPFPPTPAMRPLNCCNIYVNETLWPYWPYTRPTVRPVNRPSKRW